MSFFPFFKELVKSKPRFYHPFTCKDMSPRVGFSLPELNTVNVPQSISWVVNR